MDGKVATLAGVVALVAAPALATPTAPAVPPASSYAELLQPIPNATERLQLADAQEQAGAPQLIQAQFHHHHHHTTITTGRGGWRTAISGLADAGF
jgi:hypothetical protein